MMVFGIRRVIYYIVENNFSIFTFCSSARVASTKIRPLCSSVMIFLREAISICTCGGIVKYEPPEAPLSMGTTANPFLTLLRIFVYAFAKRFSIFVLYSSDFSRRTFSSFTRYGLYLVFLRLMVLSHHNKEYYLVWVVPLFHFHFINIIEDQQQMILNL